ncbi:hypothetical protein B0T18DRAFT_394134 [Schizothecium vesticola]|uniref:Uncharacterized protein n=1 Tax=Schizothecium vesticola TaxID=314040 RepID=A0AA40K0P5_9PEZI|nr:hypothetical protein B0T18DRAFT_394134 [Schizothecium vesticola]
MNTYTQQPSRASTDSLQEDVQKPKQPPAPQQYVYVDKVGTPNPDAQPKKKSKISSFFSKFQSPAVKATNAARERVLLEQERTGVRKVQVTDVGRSSNAWALS